MQKIIFSFIQFIKNLYEELDRAYQETYTDITVSINANKEIEKRKKANKQIFIKKVMDKARQDFYKENGFKPHNVELRAFAEDIFQIAKEKGDLDEFNNFIGEINE